MSNIGPSKPTSEQFWQFLVEVKDDIRVSVFAGDGAGP